MKRDPNYRVFKEAQDLDLYVKDTKDNDYEGWCWPGNWGCGLGIRGRLESGFGAGALSGRGTKTRLSDVVFLCIHFRFVRGLDEIIQKTQL